MGKEGKENENEARKKNADKKGKRKRRVRKNQKKIITKRQFLGKTSEQKNGVNEGANGNLPMLTKNSTITPFGKRSVCML